MSENPKDGSWPKRTARDKSHAQLMHELNPEGWTIEQHRMHKTRLEGSSVYKARIHALNDQRHAWAAEQVELDCKGRRISTRMRLQMRREYNLEARVKFPAGDPLKAGIV